MFPFALSPDDLAEELTDMSSQAVEMIKTLSAVQPEAIALGSAEREAVYRDDRMVLYHYKPQVEQIFPIPLVIVYAMINRPQLVDLQEERSLIQGLLHLGLDIYLIDWGYPTRNDRWITLDDHISGYINGCVDFVRQAHQLEALNLLGVCQGGLFSLCYAALYPNKVRNLITISTPVDFHAGDGLLKMWANSGHNASMGDVDLRLMVDILGNIPGDLINFGFLMLRPFEAGLQKYLNLMEMAGDSRQYTTFLCMEKWIYDCPDQVGETWLQFVTDFYIHNRLIKGEIELGGRRVDLNCVTMPILNLYAEHDQFVPPESSTVLGDYVGTQDYHEAAFPVGHLGMYVSGKVQRLLPQTMIDWLAAR